MSHGPAGSARNRTGSAGPTAGPVSDSRRPCPGTCHRCRAITGPAQQPGPHARGPPRPPTPRPWPHRAHTIRRALRSARPVSGRPRGRRHGSPSGSAADGSRGSRRSCARQSSARNGQQGAVRIGDHVMFRARSGTVGRARPGFGPPRRACRCERSITARDQSSFPARCSSASHPVRGAMTGRPIPWQSTTDIDHGHPGGRDAEVGAGQGVPVAHAVATVGGDRDAVDGGEFVTVHTRRTARPPLVPRRRLGLPWKLCPITRASSYQLAIHSHGSHPRPSLPAYAGGWERWIRRATPRPPVAAFNRQRGLVRPIQRLREVAPFQSRHPRRRILFQ